MHAVSSPFPSSQIFGFPPKSRPCRPSRCVSSSQSVRTRLIILWCLGHFHRWRLPCVCTPRVANMQVDRHGRGPRAKEGTSIRRYHACGVRSNAPSLAMQAQVTSIHPTDDRQHLRVADIRPVHWPRHMPVMAWARVQLRPSRLLCSSMGAPATGLQCFDRRFIVKLREETHWLCAPSWSRPTWWHWSTELADLRHRTHCKAVLRKVCARRLSCSCSAHWVQAPRAIRHAHGILWL